MRTDIAPIVVISGFSGAGKGTVIGFLQKILCKEAYFAKSYTTRKKRGCSNEHYYFVSKEEFKDLINKDFFLEWAEYGKNYYGTAYSEIKSVPTVLEINTDGMQRIVVSDFIKNEKRRVISIFVVAPSAQELYRRLQDRGTETTVSLKERLNAAVHEIETLPLYDAVLVNHDTQKTASLIAALIDGKEVSACDSFDREEFKRELKNIIATL